MLDTRSPQVECALKAAGIPRMTGRRAHTPRVGEAPASRPGFRRYPAKLNAGGDPVALYQSERDEVAILTNHRATTSAQRGVPV